MKYIVPTLITDSQLISSNVPESEYPEWSQSTVYPAGHIVSRASTHKLYKRAAFGSSPETPESDPVNWTPIGPTNRWACLDNTVGTTTKVTGFDAGSEVSIRYTLKPGQIRGLALLDMDAEGASITVIGNGQIVFEKSLDPLGDWEDVDNYYDYFFAGIVRRRLFVQTTIPPYPDCTVIVTLRGTGSVSLGSLIVGDVYSIGEVLSGVNVGILDFSLKARDDFGAINFVERGFARRMTLPLLLKTSAVDAAALRLARFRARPLVWIGSENHDSMVIYGICRDWSVIVPGPNVSTCSLEVEGLV